MGFKIVRQTDEQTKSCAITINLSTKNNLVFGLIGGSAATFSAIRELASTQFVAPCYISPFLKGSSNSESSGHTNCCGHYQNITRDSSIQCTAADLDFYK